MQRVILFCLACGWATIAWPANWVSLGSGHQGSLSIDASSIVHTGDLVHYWLRHDLPEPQLDTETGRMYQHLHVYRHMNCRARTSATQMEQVYAPDGVLIATRSEADPARMEFRAIKPHTMGAVEMRYVCRGNMTVRRRGA